MKRNKGITLITLVITIILLIILAGVVINLALGENGLLNKTKEAKNETLKQAATEKINLKITNTQIGTYSKEQRMPTLQELADNFCEDDEIEYVELESKQLASLGKIEIGENTSIFTKLKEYPYEFEINSSLQLASIDGIKIASNDTITISKEEYENLKEISETKNYDISEILTLNSNVSSVTGSIKRSGKVVHMQLTVTFKSSISPGTWVEFATINDSSIIPTEKVLGYSTSAFYYGNSQLEAGRLKMRVGEGGTVHIALLTYILD